MKLGMGMTSHVACWWLRCSYLMRLMLRCSTLALLRDLHDGAFGNLADLVPSLGLHPDSHAGLGIVDAEAEVQAVDEQLTQGIIGKGGVADGPDV